MRRTRGIPGLVYRSVRGIAGLAGAALAAAQRALAPRLIPRPSSPEREALLAALNGVLGDHLAASGNPLALPMTLRSDGSDLELAPAALARAFGSSRGRLVVLVHGLCRNDLRWRRRGHDHGAALARDLGVVPLYLRYNSGLHVSTNGRALAGLLETLCSAWPARLRRLVFLGTPHHGAPLERGGHGLEAVLGAMPYAAALARAGKLRSAGVTDLRHGYLLDEDWQGRDRFASASHPRRPVPLPAGVECHALAATKGGRAGDLADRLLGDGLVPLASALGEHPDPALDLHLPESRRWIAYGASHLDLLSSLSVYGELRDRLDGRGRARPLSSSGR